MLLPMNDQIRIEPAQPEDAAALLEIHAAAVHQTAAPYYSEKVINSWSRLPITSDRIERVKQRWIENPNHRIVVARQDNQAVGFGMYSVSSAPICEGKSIPSGGMIESKTPCLRGQDSFRRLKTI